jgi:hypothetical protein
MHFGSTKLGQTIGLVEGHELYTKRQVCERYPALRPALYREEGCSMQPLEASRQKLLAVCAPTSCSRGYQRACLTLGVQLTEGCRTTKRGNWNSFFCQRAQLKPGNTFLLQVRAMRLRQLLIDFAVSLDGTGCSFATRGLLGSRLGCPA